MLCPYCGHENTPGADECDECLQPLTPVEPAAAPPPHNILYNAVRVLKPVAPVYVSPDTTVREAIAMMVDRRIGCVLVGDPSTSPLAKGGPRGVEGIFSERDVLMKISEDTESRLEHPVREFMTAEPETVGIDDNIVFALHKMDVGDYRHLPVTEGDQVAGIISVRDILKLLVEEVAVAD